MNRNAAACAAMNRHGAVPGQRGKPATRGRKEAAACDKCMAHKAKRPHASWQRVCFWHGSQANPHVDLGQPWSALVDAGLSVGSGRAGGARSRADRVQVWDSPSYLSQILARKKIRICPLLKMPKDWREGVLLAFSGCGLGDGEQKRQITRCRASGRFCANAD